MHKLGRLGEFDKSLPQGPGQRNLAPMAGNGSSRAAFSRSDPARLSWRLRRLARGSRRCSGRNTRVQTAHSRPMKRLVRCIVSCSCRLCSMLLPICLTEA